MKKVPKLNLEKLKNLTPETARQVKAGLPKAGWSGYTSGECVNPALSGG